jgi:hypothetical protein
MHNRRQSLRLCGVPTPTTPKGLNVNAYPVPTPLRLEGSGTTIGSPGFTWGYLGSTLPGLCAEGAGIHGLRPRLWTLKPSRLLHAVEC